MDSISSILGGAKKREEPEEISQIKAFVLREYNESCQVALRQSDIIITVADGALANHLQMRLHELKTACKTQKRLRIKIGLRSE